MEEEEEGAEGGCGVGEKEEENAGALPPPLSASSEDRLLGDDFNTVSKDDAPSLTTASAWVSPLSLSKRGTTPARCIALMLSEDVAARARSIVNKDG